MNNDENKHPKILAWIDATNKNSFKKMWGMTILERNMRQLADIGIKKIYKSLSRQPLWFELQTNRTQKEYV